MLEPAAAIILNTVLSGRSHLERSIPVHSVIKIAQTISSRPLNSDFFDPQPRRVKGKARTVHDESEPVCLSSRCREWSIQTRNISPSGGDQVVIAMDAPLPRQRPRRTSFSRTPSISIQQNSSNNRTSIQQRRHKSFIADPTHDPPSHFIIEKFISMLKSPSLLDADEAWSMYVAVEKANALSQLTLDEILTFTDKLFLVGDAYYNSPSVELTQIFVWGERVQGLLSDLAPRIPPLSRYDFWSKCSMARATALMGQIDASLAHIHAARKIPLENRDEEARILWTYKTLIFYIYRYYDAPQVLTMLANEWMFVGSFLLKSSSQWQYGDTQHIAASFRKAIHRLLAHIPRPAVLIASHFTSWGPELSKRIGELLIDAYCSDQLPLHALDTLDQLKQLKVSIPLDTQLRLVRELVKEDTLGLAKDLFNTIPRGTTYKHYLQTALYLFAHCGDHRRAESYYDSLNKQNFINERDVAMIMHAYGTQGQMEKVRQMFDEFFPEESDGRRSNNPAIQHFGVAMYACARAGKIEEINYWLEEMVKAGQKPNIVIFNTIMQAFARAGDVASIRVVLDQLKSSDTPPTGVTYLQLMTTLSHTKDVAGVEALYKEAIAQGIIPSRRMVNVLTNAHVMAASWKGVIRVFDYIRSDSHPRIRLTIELYTTLIKAYVLIGAPFPVVSKIFSKLEDLNVKPDSYTFALLIQSACDAGQMSIASDIFHEMDKLATYWDSTLYIDVYILTIILAGYLRAGKRQQAKAVYDEMVARKIQPTAVTFSIMLNSYGNQRSQEALEIAEEFLKEVMANPDKTWAVPSHGKPSALELVYGPVIRGYSIMGQAQDVERMNEEYIAAGGVETLGTLSARFDVYRRTFQIDKVKELWPVIFELGVEYVKKLPILNEGDPSVNRLRNNILCLPLSMYIDALSAAGEHEEIALVWKAFQDQGFTFDAHNWNHLSVALVRAGQVERAFQIVESVILPYQDQAQNLIASRNTNPTSPLMDDEENDRVALDSQVQLRQTASKRFPNITRNMREATWQIEKDEENHADDLAYPMHILHQISPAWNVWKVHTSVSRVLLKATEDLREGNLPTPVKPKGERHLQDFEEVDDETNIRANALFDRLFVEYPRTCAMLLEFEGRERRRLGRVYSRKYVYGDSD